MDYRIRRMTRADVDLALDWAAAEGWNPGLHDAVPFFEADNRGFFLGEIDGEPVACLSAVADGDRFGFVGLYIVRPEFRGKGFGLQIWNAGMEYLGSRNNALDAVVEQQPTYRKSGFVFAHRNVRYEGIGTVIDAPNVAPLSSVPPAELIAYDRRLFPASRPEFLRSWVRQPDTVSLAAIRNDHLAGYGVLRPCRSGFKIGPLFADAPDLAEELFHGLISTQPGRPIYFDTPEPNTEAVSLAERHGMIPMFETGRMHTGTPPVIDLDRVFGITTFELG